MFITPVFLYFDSLIEYYYLQYPIESPTVSVECVHGLKEKDIAKLLSLLRDLTLERHGDPVIFDLVDVRKFIID